MVTELRIYLQENDNGDVNPSILWDASKAILRGKIIARTAMLKKDKSSNIFRFARKTEGS